MYRVSVSVSLSVCMGLWRYVRVVPVSTPYLLSIYLTHTRCVQTQPLHAGLRIVLISNTEVEELMFELVHTSTNEKGRALEFGTAMTVTVTVTATMIMAMLSWQGTGK